MPAPSEPTPLDAARLRVGGPGELGDAVTRSHLADGRVVGWYGEPGVVVDAELAAAPVPPALAAAYGTDDFWQRWTRTECAAKLAGVPIQTWLRRHGLDPGDDLELRTLRVEDLVVSLARAVTHPTISSG